MPREIVPYLQAGHALFNGLLLLGFVFLGWLGWRNRRDRIAGSPPDFAAVRRHRQLGPILALLLPLGYLAGLLTVVIDHGAWSYYPLHLLVGTMLLLVLAAAVLGARRIRGRESPWRTHHFLLGLATLLLFLVQALLGLSVLL